MEKPYDDSNWREDYAKNFCNNKRHLELLENGLIVYLKRGYLEHFIMKWKRIKGYKDEHPEENKGQCQSSLKEFYSRYKDQGI